MSPKDKLDNYLSANRPTAPKVSAALRESTWEKIHKAEHPFYRRPVMRIGVPLAALCTAMLFVILFNGVRKSEELRITSHVESSLSLSFLNDDNSVDETDPWTVLADAL